jgi:hypothetical protein
MTERKEKEEEKGKKAFISRRRSPLDLDLFFSLSSSKQAPQPPTDPEAVLRSRYGGLLANKKRGPSLHHKGGHLHQHFDSADWSMAKARTMATGNGEPPSSSSLSAAELPLLPLEEVAPPRLAPEPPAPRRASHLGEASK